MRSYRVINDYKIINRISHSVNYCVSKSIMIKDIKSNLYYLIWQDDYRGFCFDRNPSNLKGIGYMRFFGEACVFEEDVFIPCVFEEDGFIPYIYE